MLYVALIFLHTTVLVSSHDSYITWVALCPNLHTTVHRRIAWFNVHEWTWVQALFFENGKSKPHVSMSAKKKKKANTCFWFRLAKWNCTCNEQRTDWVLFVSLRPFAASLWLNLPGNSWGIFCWGPDGGLFSFQWQAWNSIPLQEEFDSCELHSVTFLGRDCKIFSLVLFVSPTHAAVFIIIIMSAKKCKKKTNKQKNKQTKKHCCKYIVRYFSFWPVVDLKLEKKNKLAFCVILWVFVKQVGSPCNADMGRFGTIYQATR